MNTIDTDYLRRIALRTNSAALLKEPKFLSAQKLFFSIVENMNQKVDFDVADMREVHAVAALAESIKGKRILDIGCGSTEPYVLGDDFRDLYPPFFAEMLTKLGADVTGIDIRLNESAKYHHIVGDLTEKNWMKKVEPSYDIIACFNLFNAPLSPFENDQALCDRIMDDMHSLLAKDGVLIATLRDDLWNDKTTHETQGKNYLESHTFELMLLEGNCAWANKTQ